MSKFKVGDKVIFKGASKTTYLCEVGDVGQHTLSIRCIEYIGKSTENCAALGDTIYPHKMFCRSATNYMVGKELESAIEGD